MFEAGRARVVSLLVIMCGGCGDSQSAAPEIRALAERACACSEPGCAPALASEVKALRDKLRARDRKSTEDEREAYERLRVCAWPVDVLAAPPTMSATLDELTVRGGFVDLRIEFPGTAPFSVRYALDLAIPAANCTAHIDDVGGSALYGGSNGNVVTYKVSFSAACTGGRRDELPFTVELLAGRREVRTVLARAEGVMKGEAATIADPWGPAPDMDALRAELAALAPIAEAGAKLGACGEPAPSGRTAGVDLDQLRAWGGDADAAGRAKAFGWESSGAFLSLTAFYAEGKHRSSAEDTARFLAPTLLVYVAETRKLPALTETAFEPGVWTGRLVVVDRVARKALCAAPLVAASSPEVGYTRRRDSAGRWSDDAETAVRADFIQQFARAMNQAVRDLSPTLSIPDQPFVGDAPAGPM